VSTLRPEVKEFALTVGEGGHKLTGTDVKIRHAEKAALFEVSEDTITRRVKALVVAGYLRMTRKPSPGYVPLYELTGPPEFDNRSRETDRNADRESAEGTHRNADRESAERSEREAEETNRKTTVNGAERYAANAPQKRGVTLRNGERERAAYKASNQVLSSLQPVSVDPWELGR